MSNSSPVEPVELVTRRSITRVSISVNSVILFESVTLLVTLYDGKDLLETRLLKFEGDDYKGWKDDDTYLLRLTLERLGFVSSPESAPEPESA
jgi:hypothetical protein